MSTRECRITKLPILRGIEGVRQSSFSPKELTENINLLFLSRWSDRSPHSRLCWTSSQRATCRDCCFKCMPFSLCLDLDKHLNYTMCTDMHFPSIICHIKDNYNYCVAPPVCWCVFQPFFFFLFPFSWSSKEQSSFPSVLVLYKAVLSLFFQAQVL